MEEKIIWEIRKYLERFDISVKDTDTHYTELERLGRYDPTTPYDNKYHLLFLFEKLDRTNPLFDNMHAEFIRICQKMEILEHKRGKKYRDMLFSYLINEINSYKGTIRFWGDPDDPDFDLESVNNLAHRDSLEILIMELKKDHDLKEIEKQVSQLDDLFKQKITETLERSLKQCPCLEKPLMPDRFWWRHLSTILAEKQQKQSRNKDGK